MRLSRNAGALGFVTVYRGADVAAGQRELVGALAMDPELASAHLFYGEALVITGDERRAKAELERALDLDPTDVAANVWLARSAYEEGRLDRAFALGRRALDLDAQSFDAAMYLAFALEAKHQFKRELEIYRNLTTTRLDRAVLRVLTARAYAVAGAPDRARALMRSLPATHDSLDLAIESAGLLAVLGDRRGAMKELASAVRRNGPIERFGRDPRLAMLWNEPTLAAIDRAQFL